MGRRGARGLRVGATLVACSVVGGVVARAHAEPPARVRLHGGAAWVASATVGQLTLIDGSTAEVVARVKVAAAGVDLDSAQDGGVGYGLDRDHGTVTRVDPTSFDPGAAVEVIEGAHGDLSLHPQGDVLYVVDHERGRVAVADASGATLRGAVRSLAEPVRSSVIDAAGRLWTLGAHTGDLTWFDGHVRGGRRHAVAEPAGATLAVVDGRAAVVEPAPRLVRTLDDHGGEHARACLDIDPADTSVRVGGSVRDHRLYVVSGDDGILRVSNLASGQCGDVAIAVAAPHSHLGTPQEAQGRVFVPDYTTGTVAVVDLAARRVVRTGELVAPGSSFELFAEDGIVFYNDPGSERAGVIAIDGSFDAVAKYDPKRPGNGLDPRGGDGPPLPDAARTVGGDEGAAGASDPGPGGAAPAPTAPADRDTPGSGAPASPDNPGGPADPARPSGPGAPPPAGEEGPGPSTDAAFVVTAAAARVTVGESLRLGTAPTDPGTTLRHVTWNFGDGSTGSGDSTQHAWDQAGTYRVVASATVAPGGTTTAFADIVVVPPTQEPLVAGFGFSPTPIHAGEPITFTDQSSGSPNSWAWTFDGVRGPSTWRQAAPPPQTWDFTGDHAVTLTVRRGSHSDTITRTVTVIDPEPEAPVVTPISIDGLAPFDDHTDYQFLAVIVSGAVDTCTWTFEGVDVPCTLGPNHAGVQATATHRFSPGHQVVELAVIGGSKTARQTLALDVQALTQPVPVIAVSGASGRNGGFTAGEGTPITLDGSGTTGTYDRLEWRDAATGATATGTTWSPTLAVGSHTIQLTAVSPRVGDATAGVTIDITPVDRTGPVVKVEQTIGVGALLGAFVNADDPETGIARIDAYGVITGTCVTPSGNVPINVQASTTPYDSGTPADFTAPLAGETGVGWVAYANVCPSDTTATPDLHIRIWAVATNGNGVTTRSADWVVDG